GFPSEIARMAWGEDIRKCIQCGNCSGTCPMSEYMDHGPRKIIAMVRAGMKADVLSSNTIWLCASCYECTVECPKEVKIADVMNALKQRALEERFTPATAPTAVLAREFYNFVRKHGRNSETWLMVNTILKTNPLKGLELVPMGLKLFSQGRMPLFEKGIEVGTGKKGDLMTIMEACDELTKY
ncbi:MAG: 4Fe-4S dicluster domain-containing protein, partial [bacterium]